MLRRRATLGTLTATHPSGPTQVGRLANRVPARAKVHALRRIFATRLAEDGATATEIQALLGHESLNPSQGYIDLTANRTRQAARANRADRAPQQLARGVTGGGAGSSSDEGLQRLIL